MNWSSKLTPKENKIVAQQAEKKFQKVINGKKLTVNISSSHFYLIFHQLVTNYSCGHITVHEVLKNCEQVEVDACVFLFGGGGYRTHKKRITFEQLRLLCLNPPVWWISVMFWRLKNYFRKEKANA